MSLSNNNSLTYNNLDNFWTFYVHLHENKNWSIDSYIKVISVNTVEEAILLNDEINYDLIKKSMIFFMKNNICPLWEHEDNKNGGCFSFKILNKDIHQVWKDIFYNLISFNLIKKIELNDKINGITLSPKKKFCILKVWMSDCELEDPNIFISIQNLSLDGCIFKKHIS